jgi:hypothetical protein
MEGVEVVGERGGRVDSKEGSWWPKVIGMPDLALTKDGR